MRVENNFSRGIPRPLESINKKKKNCQLFGTNDKQQFSYEIKRYKTVQT